VELVDAAEAGADDEGVKLLLCHDVVVIGNASMIRYNSDGSKATRKYIEKCVALLVDGCRVSAIVPPHFYPGGRHGKRKPWKSMAMTCNTFHGLMNVRRCPDAVEIYLRGLMLGTVTSTLDVSSHCWMKPTIRS